MPYPPELVRPMREELTFLGIKELLSIEEVDRALNTVGSEETSLVVVNSVCGCAAAMARPGVAMALQAPGPKPDHQFTVFAGQHLEATARMREYLIGIPPSSPFIALMKGQDPIFVIERRQIEGRTANAIAADLIFAFEKYCGEESHHSIAEAKVDGPNDGKAQAQNEMPDTFKSIL